MAHKLCAHKSIAYQNPRLMCCFLPQGYSHGPVAQGRAHAPHIVSGVGEFIPHCFLLSYKALFILLGGYSSGPTLSLSICSSALMKQRRSAICCQATRGHGCAFVLFRGTCQIPCLYSSKTVNEPCADFFFKKMELIDAKQQMFKC